jgi:hypothetical protein
MKAKEAIKKVLTKVVLVKQLLRSCATILFYCIAGGQFRTGCRPDDFSKVAKIYFGLLVYRIVCKNIYMIACLGVLGCAIALPFVSQLQSFLHLNHFVKLVFENNWHAIAKLTAVALSSLLCTVVYLAQIIVSTKKLSHAVNVIEERMKRVKEMSEAEYEAQRHLDDGCNLGKYKKLNRNIYKRIVDKYPDNNDHGDDCFSINGILSNM